MKKRIIGFLIVFTLVALIANGIQAILPAESGSNNFLLARPVLAAEANILEQEAGISAYINVGQNIDLNKIKDALSSIRAQTDTYILGTIQLQDVPEEEYPMVYATSDGWIVTYYSKLQPSSRIIQWVGYSEGTISTTTLQDAISKLCLTLGLSFSQYKSTLGYYHFQYPYAQKITIAIEKGDSGNESFTYSIPSELTMYEGSWAHDASSTYESQNTRIYFDDNQITLTWGGSEGDRGVIEPTYLTTDKNHTVTVTNKGKAAIIFLTN
jgi:hypothetical protein